MFGGNCEYNEGIIGYLRYCKCPHHLLTSIAELIANGFVAEVYRQDFKFFFPNVSFAVNSDISNDESEMADRRRALRRRRLLRKYASHYAALATAAKPQEHESVQRGNDRADIEAAPSATQLLTSNEFSPIETQAAEQSGLLGRLSDPDGGADAVAQDREVGVLASTIEPARFTPAAEPDSEPTPNGFAAEPAVADFSTTENLAHSHDLSKRSPSAEQHDASPRMSAMGLKPYAERSRPFRFRSTPKRRLPSLSKP